MKKILAPIAICVLLILVVGAATPIYQPKLQGNMNANTNSITNAVIVLASNLTATTSITLAGDTRTSWPSTSANALTNLDTRPWTNNTGIYGNAVGLTNGPWILGTNGSGTNTVLRGLHIAEDVVYFGAANNILLGSNHIANFGGALGASIIGGRSNVMDQCSHSVILGGLFNVVDQGQGIALLAGLGNGCSTTSRYGFSGGISNELDSVASFAMGIFCRVHDGSYALPAVSNSFAMGGYATAAFDNSFIWTDGLKQTNTAARQFIIMAGGGTGVLTNNPGSSALRVRGAVDVHRGTVAASEGYYISSNNPANWPTAGRHASDVYSGNSNGTPYLLTAAPGGTAWVGTNGIYRNILVNGSIHSNPFNRFIIVKAQVYLDYSGGNVSSFQLRTSSTTNILADRTDATGPHTNSITAFVGPGESFGITNVGSTTGGLIGSEIMVLN